MKFQKGIILFGIIEICIGMFMFCDTFVYMLAGKPARPPEVVTFILTTSLISAGLGVGILRYHIHSYHLLLFFSCVIILSKILIFGHIISLNDALETQFPFTPRNIVSIMYHGILIAYFIHPVIKKRFKEIV
ncbi:MAG: hypothetical protein WDL87_07845 [Candidatus Omnitrophota bacterium]|jgi:hypothetical protein